MYCQKCRSELSDNAVICIACGTEVSKKSQPPKITLCNNCGLELSNNAKICIGCGKNIKNKKRINNPIKAFFKIEFIKLLFATATLFGISLIIAILIDGSSSYGSYEEVAMGFPFFISSIILLVFFFRNTLNVKKIWRIFILLIAIAGAVSSSLFSYQQYERAERYEQRRIADEKQRIAEEKLKIAREKARKEQINFEKKLSTDNLHKYITISKSKASTAYSTLHYKARWDADEYGYYYTPESSETRVDGSTVSFYITNNLKYTTMSCSLKITGETYRKVQNDDFVWPATTFTKYITVDKLKPGESRYESVFFDSYVNPRPQHGFAVIGKLISSFASDTSKAKERVPINQSTLKFKMSNLRKN